MKKILLCMTMAIALVAGKQAQANGALDQLVRDMAVADLTHSVNEGMRVNNLINWKVGETAEYDLKAMFGSLGNMVKKVDREQGNAIWLKQEVTGMAAQTIEALIDRATGEVLEMRQNGQKVNPPNDKPEMIDQEHTTVTVPAGTFEVIHVTFKSKEVKKGELWANPRDIPMDGAAKMAVESNQMPLPITMELLKFSRP
ncbi:MAG: hypothetical protein HUU37_03535 [Bdellovibrionales bacterium]|nr:hypothetical protein [Bdellovibrionales bacterium]